LCLVSHLGESRGATLITPISIMREVFRANAAMRANLGRRDVASIKQPHHILTRHIQKIGGLLAGQLFIPGQIGEPIASSHGAWSFTKKVNS
jgi:hypothetical protein